MSPQQSESRELDKVIVRLPDGMRDKLKEAAAKNNRSMNAEIVDRLESSVVNAKLIDDYRLAEERLMEQARTEQELRKQITLLEDQIALMKMQSELGHPIVEESNERVGLAAQIVDALQSVFGSKADMRETVEAMNRAAERMERIKAGLEEWPLVGLSDEQQEELKALASRSHVSLDDTPKPKSKRDQTSRVANDDLFPPATRGAVQGGDRRRALEIEEGAEAPAEPADGDKGAGAAKTATRGQKPPKGAL